MSKLLSDEVIEHAKKVISRYDDEIYFKSIELRHFINQLTYTTSEIERLTSDKMRYTKLLKEAGEWNVTKSTTDSIEKKSLNINENIDKTEKEQG